MSIVKEFVEKLIERLEEYKYTHLTERDSEVWLHCTETNCGIGEDCCFCVMDKAKEIVKKLAEEYNSELIEKINFAIGASNTNDNYMTGLRNGMRYCLALIDGKEPEFESCNQDSTENNQGWISCRERLPEDNKDVLVWQNGIHSIAWYSKKVKRWFSNDFPAEESRDVIAWQPLPDPYKQEEDTPSKSSSFEKKPNFYSERFNKVM